MALVNKTNQPVIPKKRHLDDNCELEEIGKSRMMFTSKPKIRIGVQVVRDFPTGCGTIQDRERFPFKNVDSKKDNKLKNLVPKRPPGKVKFWDPSEGDARKSEDGKAFVVSEKEKVRRKKINEAMKMFDEVYKELYKENSEKEKGKKIAHWRVPSEAVKIVKQKLKWIDVGKKLGPICGVQVGDKFRYRSQLQMIGIHCQPQSGIDYMDVRGKNLAISIVDSNRYKNGRQSCDVLKYSGQGGMRFFGNKEVLPEDQKLERGNLALKNSMDEKNVVRVVRKIHEVGGNNDVFVYDGLYIVKSCKEEKGDQGKMVFMFELKRIAGQPQLHKMLNEN